MSIASRFRDAWGALRGAELASSPPAPTRAVGYPYRVDSAHGLLTGADLNTSFDGTTKYDRYREMRRDPEICATMALLDWPALSAKWSLQGGDDDVREWLAGVVFSPPHRQALPWRQLLYHVLFWRWYGCYTFERVWTRGEDGLVYAYLSPRPPDSVSHWWLDGLELKGITQEFHNSEGQWKEVYVDGKRLIHFVYGGEANNVEGESLLRSCWGEYVSTKAARELRNIQMERCTGVLKVSPRIAPSGGTFPLVDGEHDDAILSAKNFVGHHSNYVVESQALQIEFMQTASDGMKQCVDVMRYGNETYKSRILADFMNQGRRETGSRSTAGVQEGPFWTSQYGDMETICEKLRREWLAPMVRANWGDEAASSTPRLAFSDLRSKGADEEIKPLLAIMDRGMSPLMGEEIQKHLFQRAGAPQSAINAIGQGTGAERSNAISNIPGGSPRGDGTRDDNAPQQPIQKADMAYLDYEVDPANPKASEGRLHRAPTELEQLLELETVAGRWDESEQEANRLMDEYRARVIAMIMERARKEMAPNKPLTMEQITAIQVAGLARKSLVSEYTRKLTALAMESYEAGSTDVVQELERLGGKPAGEPPVIKTPSTKAYSPVDGKGEVKKVVKSLASSGLTELAQRLGTEAASEAAGQMVSPSPSLDRVLGRMSGMSRNNAYGVGRGVVSTGYAGGRNDSAKRSGASLATYSTLLEDGRTCRPCERLHLEVFKVGSAEYESSKPPFKDCRSTRSSSGRNRCRCIFIYTFENETT